VESFFNGDLVEHARVRKLHVFGDRRLASHACAHVYTGAQTQTGTDMQRAHFRFRMLPSFRMHPRARSSCMHAEPQPHICHPAAAVGEWPSHSTLATHTRTLSGPAWGSHTRMERHGILRPGERLAPAYRAPCPCVSETPALASTAARSRGPREPASGSSPLLQSTRCTASLGPTQAVALGAAEGAAEEGLARLGGAHAILPELRTRLTRVLPPQTRVSTWL